MGERDVRRRVAVFEPGEWRRLLDRARQAATKPQMRTGNRTRSDTENDKAEINAAISLIQKGELSHARLLISKGLAPGTRAMCDELVNPLLRPAEPAEYVLTNHTEPLELDKGIVAQVLCESRRGRSGG
eukprot:6287419-Pyramimonas_sp.AAC.1